MPDIKVTIILPTGGTHTAEMPDDVAVKDLIPELVTALNIPTTGPDGRPVGYRLDSKGLGRRLKDEETLSAAAVPAEDRLILTPDVTAGAPRLVLRPRSA